MSWPLLILVISAFLIQDFQTAPKSISLRNKQDISSSSDDQRNLCEQCQLLEVSIIWTRYPAHLAVTMLKNICNVYLASRYHQNPDFCTHIHKKEAEFVNTILDYKKNGTEKEVCARSNFSVCDLSQIDSQNVWKPINTYLVPLNTCDQCQMAVLGVITEMTNELPYGRVQYYTKTADSLKKLCRDTFTRKYFSEFCTLFEEKESGFVKSVMDCSGMKFKDDKVQPNCTVTGSNDDRGRMIRICGSYVESCDV